MLPLDSLLIRRCCFLAGPTAVGKSALSLLLAQELDAEIVALDSMTLYRGMDIGTAKPTPADRAIVPHHLIDLIEPHIEFSLAEYCQAASTIVEQILRRDKVPLFVGGTGLYLRGLLRGMFDGPGADWDLRSELESIATTQGADELHRMLAAVDPVLAARLPPADVRRVVRGIEVYRLTGIPLSVQQVQDPRPPEEWPHLVCWLSPPREWLHQRINQRVEQMFADGLEAEVRSLAARPGGLSRTARQALGYKEILDVLEAGQPAHSALELIQLRTRQFAKRQQTWFRNLVECQEIAVDGTETVADLVQRLLSCIRGRRVTDD